MRFSVRRTISLATVALLLATSLNAQERTGRIHGVVQAADDGAVLAGTTVEVMGGALRTLSDDAGRYAFDGVPLGTISLRFERLGYVTLTKTVTAVDGQETRVSAEMVEGPIRIDPITVLLKRTRMIGDPLGMDEIPGSAHVLVAADLASPAFIFDNVHDFLRLVPGVNVQDEDGFGLRPNIGLRGTGVDRSSKITLMEDGVLIAPAPYTAPSAYYFPVAGRMEAVEVRKGSSQVRYGPRTIGGAVNMVSSSIPDRMSWFAEAAGGESGTLRGHARVGSSSARFGWLMEAYSLETDGFKMLTSGAPTGFDVTDLMGKLRINSDRSGLWYQELELKVGYTDEESSATYLGLTDADFAVNPLHRYPASASDLMTAEHSQVQLRHFWVRGSVDITTTVYRNDFARNWYKLQSVLGEGISSVLDAPDQYASALAVLRGGGSDPDALRVRANNRDYYAQGVQSTVGIDRDGHSVEMGVRFHRDQEDRFQWEDAYQMLSEGMTLTNAGDPGSQANRVSSADAAAFFIQDEVDLGRLVLSPGVRFEHIDFTRTDYAGDDPARTVPTRVRENRVDAWIPGVGFSYRAAGALNLFGGVHRGFGPQGPGADESTRPESSANFELGSRWRAAGLAAEASVFFSDYRNILGRATLATAEDGTGEAFNGGEAAVMGVEASVDYDVAWSRDWNTRVPLRISYTLTRAEFRSAFESEYDPWGNVEVGDRLPYLPQHQLSASLGLDRPGWSVTLSTVGSGAMRTRAGRGGIPDGEGTDSYLIFNVAGEMHLPRLGTFFIGIQNLSDQRYSVARRPAGLRPGLPRTMVAGLRVTGAR